MAISFVSADGATTAGAGGNPTITFGVSLLQDDIVVVFGGINNQTDVAGISTSGYTQLAQFNSTTGAASRNMWIGYKRMGSTPDTSATCLGGASESVYEAMYFRGVDTSTAIDQTTTTTFAQTTNPDCPSITTVTDNAAVLALAFSNRDTAITIVSGYSNLSQKDGAVSSTVAGSWVTKATAGAEDPGAYTNWITGKWCAATVALRPASPIFATYYYREHVARAA